MQRLDWAGCPRWLPHVIGSWCWTSAVNSVWDYQWPASSFSVWLQYGDWETSVPTGRKHKMLGKWRAMPGASTTWFLPYFIGRSPLPCQDSRGGHRDARSWWGSVKTTLRRTRGMGDIVAAAIFGETVCHALNPSFSAFPACSYSKRQRALGMIPCMEQLPNINYYWPLACRRYHVNKYKRRQIKMPFLFILCSELSIVFLKSCNHRVRTEFLKILPLLLAFNNLHE